MNGLNAAPSSPHRRQRLIDTGGLACKYAFYAYACSAMVNILRRTSSTPPSQSTCWSPAASPMSTYYVDGFQGAGVTVHVEETPKLHGRYLSSYYQDCLLKLPAFKLRSLDPPALKRVLAFDSDQLVMKNLDHLFAGLPDVDLAAPRAYWLAKDFLASTNAEKGFGKRPVDSSGGPLVAAVGSAQRPSPTLIPGVPLSLSKALHGYGTSAGRQRLMQDFGSRLINRVSSQLPAPLLPVESSAAVGPPSAIRPPAATASAAYGDEPLTSPRFPFTRSYTDELYRLQDAAAVIANVPSISHRHPMTSP